MGTPGQQRSAQQVGHPLAVRQRQHHVGVRADGVDRVGDGHPDLAGIQQAVVVLGVADADRVVVRQAQIAERLEQAAALGHPGRQDHQLAPVADELAVQAELADHLQRGRLVGGGAGDQHLPVAVGDTTGGQRRAHRAADGGGQQADADRGDHHGAVLGDDRVDVLLDLREHGAQLAHDPPGDQDHPDPPGARLGERGQRVGRDLALGQGAVEVGRHRPEVADALPSAMPSTSSRYGRPAPPSANTSSPLPVSMTRASNPPARMVRNVSRASSSSRRNSSRARAAPLSANTSSPPPVSMTRASDTAGPDGAQCLPCLVELSAQFLQGIPGHCRLGISRRHGEPRRA